MTQWFRELVVLTEDRGSIPGTRMAAQQTP